MGQRICVMNKGRVAQIGRPMDVYRAPADAFVARFLGNPPMNIVSATLVTGSGGTRMAQVGGSAVSLARWDGVGLGTSDKVLLGVRPEELSLAPGGAVEGQAQLRGKVMGVEPLGGETLAIVALEGGTGQITARLHRDTAVQVEQAITLQCPLEAVYLFDVDTEKAIAARGL